jgi:hypothetical protein
VVCQRRCGSCARIPRVRRCRRNALASSPLSVASTLGRLRGRPGLPVWRRTASSRGSTGARSLPWAGVVRLARGLPAASVRRWRRLPWPVPPRATPSPPPVPGGKRAVDRAVLPLNHPVFLGQPAEPRLPGHERALGVPPLQPPRGRTFGRPLGATWEIAPAAAGDESVEQGVDDRANGSLGHTPAPSRWWRRKNVRKPLPFQGTQPVEASGPRTLLPRKRAL